MNEDTNALPPPQHAHPWLAAVWLATLLPWLGHCHTPPATPARVSKPPVSVRVVRAVRRAAHRPVTVFGTVQAKQRATLAAKASGRILRLPVALGQRLKRGQLVARLQVPEAQAALAQAKAQATQSETEAKRAAALLQAAAITPQRFEQAQNEAARAAALLHEARSMAAYSSVRAPFTGVVTKKWAETGDMAMPGRPLVDLEQPGTWRVEVAVPVASRGALRLDQPLTVRPEGRALAWQGRIREIAPAADTSSRTVKIHLDVPADVQVHSGQFVRVDLPGRPTQRVFVPARAVQQRGQLQVLFIVDARQKARMRLVRTGRQEGTRVEVLSGLRGGERVILTGPKSLRDGRAVRVQS